MERAKPSVIITDWDDTKVETFGSVSLLYQQFAAHKSIEIPEISVIKGLWGNPIPLLIAGMWQKENAVLLQDEFKKYCQQLDFSVKPFDYTKQTIVDLQDMNMLLSVLSSGPRYEIERTVIRHLELPLSTYVLINGGEDTPSHKPEPQVFDNTFQALKKYGKTEKDAAYVGDSIGDMRAARARGLGFYAVLTGLASREEFLQEGLDEQFILVNISELPAKLKG